LTAYEYMYGATRKTRAQSVPCVREVGMASYLCVGSGLELSIQVRLQQCSNVWALFVRTV